MTLAVMLEDTRVTVDAIRAHVNGLSPDARVADCLSVTASQQKRLWELASQDPASKSLLLPPGAGTAAFAGRNSLRLFTRFEKRFGRLGPTTVGYNRHLLSWLIGPGYFTVESGDHGLRFDYEHVPADAPPGWPAVVSNSRAFARPVYGHLLDRVEWVTPDVLVGSAFRSDAPLDSYFVLARLPE